MNDITWVVIYAIAFMAFAFGSMAYATHSHNECVKAFSTSTKSATEISAMCKR